METQTETPREAWLASRSKGIGGSEASTIMDINPWDSKFALWSRKVGLIVDTEENEAMEWGRRLETAVGEKFFDDTEYTETTEPEGLDCDVLFDKPGYRTYKARGHDWMLATPDGFVVDKNGEVGLLEVKTARADKYAQWENGTAPLHYFAQVQHYMSVTGLKYACFAVLFGGQKFAWVRVERDDEFIADLRDKEWKFWALVTTEIPPEPDDSKATENALKALYPTDTGEEVALPGEVDEWDDELVEVNAQLRELKEHKRALETRIKAKIGSATKGIMPSGVAFTLKRVDVPAREAKAYSFRKLMRVKAKG